LGHLVLCAHLALDDREEAAAGQVGSGKKGAMKDFQPVLVMLGVVLGTAGVILMNVHDESLNAFTILSVVIVAVVLWIMTAGLILDHGPAPPADRFPSWFGMATGRYVEPRDEPPPPDIRPSRDALRASYLGYYCGLVLTPWSESPLTVSMVTAATINGLLGSLAFYAVRFSWLFVKKRRLSRSQAGTV
jgi:hypothetical protein